MNFRTLFLSATIGLLLVSGLGAAASAGSDTTATGKAAVVPGTPASVLKQGMSADAVLKLLGKPEQIKPMKTPNGKAEVWVFTREIGTRMERMGLPSASIVTNTMGADGKIHQETIPGPIEYHDVRYVTEETTELLMFNDHFVTHKVSRRERQSFQ